jgi:hypothetical protein
LAASTGLWHLESSSGRRQTKIEIDPTGIIKTMRSYEREMSKFKDITEAYPSVMTIEYEELFDGMLFSSDVIGRLARFLEIEPDFDLTPRLHKIMPTNWADAFSNAYAIERAVSEAGYEHMLA